MSNHTTFYVCKHCGNLAGMIHDAGVPMICCGEEMKELIPNTVDAASEKHLPVITQHDGIVEVSVGSVEHPETAEHLIEWIYLLTENGGQRKCLKAGGSPSAVFVLESDKATAAYAYCNLHGLWKTDI